MRPMSTWISEPPRIALAALAALLVLAGCFETEALSRIGPRAAGSGPGAITVLDGAVTVAGPDGFCVDESATREAGDNAFVLLRHCRGSRGPVLSVTVTDQRVPAGDRSAQLDALAAFLATEAGRGQLSRRGRAGDVAIDQIGLREGTLWLHLTDIGNPESFEAGYWRSVLPVAGRLVTLSAMSLREAPSSRAAGERAMGALIDTLRRRNLD